MRYTDHAASLRASMRCCGVRWPRARWRRTAL